MIVRYRIDNSDRIVEVNDGWTAFAESNEGSMLAPSLVVGRALTEFVTDLATLQLYSAIFSRIRRGGGPIGFSFRCDAPARRRLLAMAMSADGSGGIWFNVTSVAEEAREPVTLLEMDQQRDARLISMCGWCKRVAIPGGWSEVEQAVKELGLFIGETLPMISHGMCPDCYAAMDAALEDTAEWKEPRIGLILPSSA